jgi:hypothetical protein
MKKIRAIERSLYTAAITLLMIGCDVDSETKYHQLTSDDLTHLYINLDTLTYDGNEIEYTDSVRFLLNAKDTITVAAKTQIWSTIDQFAFVDLRDMHGKSSIHFSSETGLDYVYVHLYRSNSSNYPPQKTFTVSLVDGNFWPLTHILNEIISGPYSLDTSVILGRIYENVYKFDLCSTSDYTGVKSVYFAKKYGFIKIEGHDGSKLELIGVKSKGMKEAN